MIDLAFLFSNTMKYSFKNDYSEGAHPEILNALVEHNLVQQTGYGLDDFTAQAERLILKKINSEDSKVFFVSGGTQANLIVISSILKPYESVISADTGHIFTNETGAIESTGHKIHAVETTNGKLSVSHIQKVLDQHTNFPHQLMPKLVYISNSTELGTHYSKKELQELSSFCKAKNLYLFMDGARLGHALTAENNDVNWEHVAELTDVFYIGGTKNGALFGEAIVINQQHLQENFAFHLKQKGALLAKGRTLGIQFQTLFENNLYLDLAQKANQQAMKIKAFLEYNGVEFLTDTYTNQIFPILTSFQIEFLANHFEFYVWKKLDENRSAIRLITSWATEDEVVQDFIRQFKKILPL